VTWGKLYTPKGRERGKNREHPARAGPSENIGGSKGKKYAHLWSPSLEKSDRRNPMARPALKVVEFLRTEVLGAPSGGEIFAEQGQEFSSSPEDDGRRKGGEGPLVRKRYLGGGRSQKNKLITNLPARIGIGCNGRGKRG